MFLYSRRKQKKKKKKNIFVVVVMLEINVYQNESKKYDPCFHFVT